VKKTGEVLRTYGLVVNGSHSDDLKMDLKSSGNNSFATQSYLSVRIPRPCSPISSSLTRFLRTEINIPRSNSETSCFDKFRLFWISLFCLLSAFPPSPPHTLLCMSSSSSLYRSLSSLLFILLSSSPHIIHPPAPLVS
jgi:hypothetical protein